jgi:hypothetical protein
VCVFACVSVVLRVSVSVCVCVCVCVSHIYVHVDGVLGRRTGVQVLGSTPFPGMEKRKMDSLFLFLLAIEQLLYFSLKGSLGG